MILIGPPGWRRILGGGLLLPPGRGCVWITAVRLIKVVDGGYIAMFVVKGPSFDLQNIGGEA